MWFLLIFLVLLIDLIIIFVRCTRSNELRRILLLSWSDSFIINRKKWVRTHDIVFWWYIQYGVWWSFIPFIFLFVKLIVLTGVYVLYRFWHLNAKYKNISLHLFNKHLWPPPSKWLKNTTVPGTRLIILCF